MLTTRSSYKPFKFSLGLTLLALTVFLLLLKLGFWQLSRAAEKNHLLTTAHRASAQPAISWPSSHLPKPYQRLQITGRYLPDILLLDNQFYRHRLGFYVLNAFQTTTGQILLIDRGWLARPQKGLFPSVPIPEGDQPIQGSVYYPSTKGMLLGNIVEAHDKNNWIIEKLDLKLIEKILQHRLTPFIMRLDKQSPGGFVREWPIVAMQPTRHYAYAVQWFALAATVLIIYMVLSFKRS